MPDIDVTHQYKGLTGLPSRCRIRLWGLPQGVVPPSTLLVLVTELEDNPGSSISTMAVSLATEITRAYTSPLGPTPALLWVEHYPASRSARGQIYAEEFARVEFHASPTGETDTRRINLTRAELAQIIVEPLEATDDSYPGRCFVET